MNERIHNCPISGFVVAHMVACDYWKTRCQLSNTIHSSLAVCVCVCTYIDQKWIIKIIFKNCRHQIISIIIDDIKKHSHTMSEVHSN